MMRHCTIAQLIAHVLHAHDACNEKIFNLKKIKSSRAVYDELHVDSISKKKELFLFGKKIKLIKF